MEGEDVSEGDWEDDDEGFWKSFVMSALDGLDVDAVDAAAVEDSALELEGVEDMEGRGDCFDDPVADVEAEVLPFTWLGDVAGTDPKDFTTSVFTAGMAAGDEDNGAEASSIDPNTTDAGRTTDPTLFRGTETPSFTDTPWPNALGRLE